MADKFEGFNRLCEYAKLSNPGGNFVIVQDLSILGDTVQEVMDNIKKYFRYGGKKIETADGITISSQEVL